MSWEPEFQDEVPESVLADALCISERYVPIDGTQPDPGYEWDWETEREELSKLAVERGVNDEALGCRLDALSGFLSTPEGQAYYSREGDRIVVEPGLLSHAARSPVDNSNAIIEWPVQQSAPAVE